LAAKTKDKRKYNKSAYRRYEFSVRLDSKLEYLLERYMAKTADNSLSELIKNLLCEHFGIELDDLWVPVRSGYDNEGRRIKKPNCDLDNVMKKHNLKHA